MPARNNSACAQGHIPEARQPARCGGEHHQAFLFWNIARAALPGSPVLEHIERLPMRQLSGPQLLRVAVVFGVVWRCPKLCCCSPNKGDPYALGDGKGFYLMSDAWFDEYMYQVRPTSCFSVFLFFFFFFSLSFFPLLPPPSLF
jgi:hypothetical protein